MKTQHLTQKLVLGSSSSYRYELLLRLQIPFEVSSPDIDETALSGELPEATACRLAENKARAVAAVYPNALIIGADQVASLSGSQIGKPFNHENATKQLYFMRGKEVIFPLIKRTPNKRAFIKFSNKIWSSVNMRFAVLRLKDHDEIAYPANFSTVTAAECSLGLFLLLSNFVN